MGKVYEAVVYNETHMDLKYKKMLIRSKEMDIKKKLSVTNSNWSLKKREAFAIAMAYYPGSRYGILNKSPLRLKTISSPARPILSPEHYFSPLAEKESDDVGISSSPSGSVLSQDNYESFVAESKSDNFRISSLSGSVFSRDNSESHLVENESGAISQTEVVQRQVTPKKIMKKRKMTLMISPLNRGRQPSEADLCTPPKVSKNTEQTNNNNVEVTSSPILGSTRRAIKIGRVSKRRCMKMLKLVPSEEETSITTQISKD